MKRHLKKSYTGTEMESSTSRIIERMGGASGGSSGKVRFKYRPTVEGARNISGPTQKAWEGPKKKPSEGPLSQKKKINYLLKDFHYLAGVPIVAAADKFRKKNTQGTILTMP